jgi:hypothetical protein
MLVAGLVLAVVLVSIGRSSHTVAMLVAILPFAVVFVAIGHSTHTVAILLVVLVLAVVLVATGPSMHNVEASSISVAILKLFQNHNYQPNSPPSNIY